MDGTEFALGSLCCEKGLPDIQFQTTISARPIEATKCYHFETKFFFFFLNITYNSINVTEICQVFIIFTYILKCRATSWRQFRTKTWRLQRLYTMCQVESKVQQVEEIRGAAFDIRKGTYKFSWITNQNKTKNSPLRQKLKQQQQQQQQQQQKPKQNKIKLNKQTNKQTNRQTDRQKTPFKPTPKSSGVVILEEKTVTHQWKKRKTQTERKNETTTTTTTTTFLAPWKSNGAQLTILYLVKCVPGVLTCSDIRGCATILCLFFARNC